ncbi:MAG: alpha/beta hydrolase [Cyclobacteriaceae bacterium]|nr:alpha/beta hydrolase [Cyclobacteriaceae bacterium]
MKTTFILTIVLYMTFQSLYAQETLKLWTGKIPYSTGLIGEEEITDQGHVRNIQDPDITVYLPDKEKATGAAVVICPGGGYWLLAIKHEGHDIARWFNSIGVAGIVVKNRLPTSDNITDKSEVAMTDAQRAVRMTRYHAEKWGIAPGKIGIMGFSAGGHLASTVGTHFDLGIKDAKDPIQQVSCRPDFMVLVYPVISMSGDIMHTGSMKSLLGENPSDAQMLRFSNEKQVTKDTPPAILIHSSDDTGVPVANSIGFYEALLAHGVAAELHLFHSGGHGYGLGRGDGTSHNMWPQNVQAWMKDMNLLSEGK